MPHLELDSPRKPRLVPDAPQLVPDEPKFGDKAQQIGDEFLKTGGAEVDFLDDQVGRGTRQAVDHVGRTRHHVPLSVWHVLEVTGRAPFAASHGGEVMGACGRSRAEPAVLSGLGPHLPGQSPIRKW